MERSFPRRIDALDEIFRFVHASLASIGTGEDRAFDVALVIEELFVNAIRSAPDNPHEVRIGLERSADRVRLTFTDCDVEPFDIRNAPIPRIDAPIEERVPGGLGIHIVRHLADAIDYEYADRKSRTTVFMRIS